MTKALAHFLYKVCYNFFREYIFIRRREIIEFLTRISLHESYYLFDHFKRIISINLHLFGMIMLLVILCVGRKGVFKHGQD